jgi:hypothetical protein
MPDGKPRRLAAAILSMTEVGCDSIPTDLIHQNFYFFGREQFIDQQEPVAIVLFNISSC